MAERMSLSPSVATCAKVTASQVPEANFQVALSRPGSKRVAPDDGSNRQTTTARTAISIADATTCAKKKITGLDPNSNNATMVSAPRKTVAATMMVLDSTC